MALSLVGIQKIVIVQNKIDVVSQKDAIAHFQQIKKFIAGTIAENAPIIPVSAQKKINLGALIEALHTTIPEPERDATADPLMLIARSFDINKPGSSWKDLKGGVVGGSVIRGVLRDGDEIEIRPGLADSGREQDPVGADHDQDHLHNGRLEKSRGGGSGRIDGHRD
jgi:translation initiation factor 2 subunit gamma (aeIF-2g)